MLLVQDVGGGVLTQFILANASPPGAWPAPLPGPGWRPRHHLRVYQPHEAREDTVVFPSSAGSSAAGELADLGRHFADLERQQFGGGEFSAMVPRVAGIDRLARAVQAAKV